MDILHQEVVQHESFFHGNEVVHLHEVECLVDFVILLAHSSICAVKCFGEVSLLDELDP